MRRYPHAHILATNFAEVDARAAVAGGNAVVRWPAACCRGGWDGAACEPRARAHAQGALYDIIGQRVCLQTLRPLVFFWNVGRMHWNVVRVLMTPVPVLELFEPMGCARPRALPRAGVVRRSVVPRAHARVPA